MTQPIEITHEWTAQQWDWPLQHNDGVVRIHDLPNRWEVGLDVAYFTPNEIEVKVVGDHLNIHCKHESRSDEHGSVSREINRSYKLPDNVNIQTIKVLIISVDLLGVDLLG
uniref:SHSP domain-containing protein n=1 Tax=Meloidogyne hapla TaxID=6305 RepID=A0A1I8BDY3_MELHA